MIAAQRIDFRSLHFLLAIFKIFFESFNLSYISINNICCSILSDDLNHLTIIINSRNESLTLLITLTIRHWHLNKINSRDEKKEGNIKSQRLLFLFEISLTLFPLGFGHVIYNRGDIKVSQPSGNMVKRRSITLLKAGCFAWSFRGSR